MKKLKLFLIVECKWRSQDFGKNFDLDKPKGGKLKEGQASEEKPWGE